MAAPKTWGDMNRLRTSEKVTCQQRSKDLVSGRGSGAKNSKREGERRLHKNVVTMETQTTIIAHIKKQK